MSGTRLELAEVCAQYGETTVLDSVSLAAAPGELIALLGPSGCGKTTALKVIAGLHAPSRGEVRFDAETMNAVPPERRRAAMVFQKPLLFPYLNVRENVGFGLKMRKSENIAARVAEALDMVQLRGFEVRRATELSGGQEQRVALARALVTEPRVLLLDEPFSALDESLRGEMRSLVRDLQQRLGITTVFVTHDQDEAVELADRIALLLQGRVAQIGPAREFYTAPASAEVARFFGWQRLPGASAEWFLPQSARLAAAGDGFPVTVDSVIDLGSRLRYTVRAASGEIYRVESGERLSGAAVMLVPAEVRRRLA